MSDTFFLQNKIREMPQLYIFTGAQLVGHKNTPCWTKKVPLALSGTLVIKSDNVHFLCNGRQLWTKVFPPKKGETFLHNCLFFWFSAANKMDGEDGGDHKAQQG